MTHPRTFGRRILSLALLSLVMVASWASVAGAETSFREDVFPIIQIRCLECHQPGGVGYETSGLDLRTYEGLMKGTRYGSMVTPGNAQESNLLAVIDRRTSKEVWMPHQRKQLSKCERQVFRFWVQQGARNN